jgi:hypothetical protein
MKKSRKTRKETALKRENLRNKRQRKRDEVRKENSSSRMIENLEKEVSKPSSIRKYGKGNKVRLFHFTSPMVVKSILRTGLEKGFVWMEETNNVIGKANDLTCIPCITSNPIGSNNGQSNHGCDHKELVRFSFLIDKDDPQLKEYPLWFWNECNEYGYDPLSAHKYYQQHKRTGNNNIQDWFVYEGIIRPEMVESVYLKSNVDGKYYDSKELQTWTWNGLRYETLPEPEVVSFGVCAKYNIYKDYTGYLENNKPPVMSMFG